MFKLNEMFLDQFRGKQPQWGYNGLGYVVYLRTYSRQKDDGTHEEFWETCQRVVEGCYTIQLEHCQRNLLPWNSVKAQRSAQEMYKRMWQFKWLPPGRGLWMMGAAAMHKTGAALNNCGFVSTLNIASDFSEPFCWLMDMSMLGVGVGFDTEGAGQVVIQAPDYREQYIHVVEDSREGWVDALRHLLNSFATASGSVEFDMCKVRPEGSPIKGFGGVSSGPEPLRLMLESIRAMLTDHIGRHITSSMIVDICNLIGKCVVSGNVRRSAEIAFGDPQDLEFLNLKNPSVNADALISHRWASNNSVFASVGMDYSRVAELTARNGEPGYEWLSNAREYSRMGTEADYKDAMVAGANPCVEQSLEDRELCCLVETFPGNHVSVRDYLETLRYAYLYAKTVTLVSTHCAETNRVMQRNRRIGCSMSGIVQAMAWFGRREFLRDFCDRGYFYLQSLDAKYSNWLCVRPSIKITSVKPSGTVSLLPGVTPGIHFPHSQYYIRRVRIQTTSPLVSKLEAAGYSIETDMYSPNTVCVSFPVQELNYERSKSDVTMWEQLELAAQMQTYWADNQVSVTVTFKPEEAKDIKYALELYEVRLKGVSFLPLEDHGYAQAPYEEISADVYTSMISKIRPYAIQPAWVHDTSDVFCDADMCQQPKGN